MASGATLTRTSLVLLCVHGALSHTGNLRKIDLEMAQPALPPLDESAAFCKSQHRAEAALTLVPKMCASREDPDCAEVTRLRIVQLIEALCDGRFSDSQMEVMAWVQRGGDLSADLCGNEGLRPIVEDFLAALCASADPNVADQVVAPPAPPATASGPNGMHCVLWAEDEPQAERKSGPRLAKDAKQAEGVDTICGVQNRHKMLERVLEAVQLACARFIKDKWRQLNDKVCTTEQPAQAVRELLKEGCEFAAEHGDASGMYEVCSEENSLQDVEDVLKQLCTAEVKPADVDDSDVSRGDKPHVQALVPIPGLGSDGKGDKVPPYYDPDYLDYLDRPGNEETIPLHILGGAKPWTPTDQPSGSAQQVPLFSPSSPSSGSPYFSPSPGSLPNGENTPDLSFEPIAGLPMFSPTKPNSAVGDNVVPYDPNYPNHLDHPNNEETIPLHFLENDKPWTSLDQPFEPSRIVPLFPPSSPSSSPGYSGPSPETSPFPPNYSSRPIGQLPLFPPSEPSSSPEYSGPSPETSPFPPDHSSRPIVQPPLFPPSEPSSDAPPNFAVPPSSEIEPSVQQPPFSPSAPEVLSDKRSSSSEESDSSSSEEYESRSRPATSPSRPLPFCTKESQVKIKSKMKQICKSGLFREYCDMLTDSTVDFICGKLRHFAKGYCGLPDRGQFVSDSLNRVCSLLDMLSDLKPTTKMECEDDTQAPMGPLTRTLAMLKKVTKKLCSEKNIRATQAKADELLCSTKEGSSGDSSDDDCIESESDVDLSHVLDDSNNVDTSESFQMAIDRRVKF